MSAPLDCNAPRRGRTKPTDLVLHAAVVTKVVISKDTSNENRSGLSLLRRTDGKRFYIDEELNIEVYKNRKK